MVPRHLEVGTNWAHLGTAAIGHSQWMPFLAPQDSMLDSLNSTTSLGVPLVSFPVPVLFGFVMTLTVLLEPLSELLQQIFPWVESELVALNVHVQDNRCSKDIALRQFLKLLVWLRTVLLQDAAILHSLYPHSRLFSHQPFNTKLFWEFATSSVAIIAHAKCEACLAFKNMPDHLIAGLCGSYAELWLEQHWEQEENTHRRTDCRR
jgi:hypothetical protein